LLSLLALSGVFVLTPGIIRHCLALSAGLLLLLPYCQSLFSLYQKRGLCSARAWFFSGGLREAGGHVQYRYD
jgi:UPF0716 family protein affecting phage T7 exclusion